MRLSKYTYRWMLCNDAYGYGTPMRARVHYYSSSVQPWPSLYRDMHQYMLKPNFTMFSVAHEWRNSGLSFAGVERRIANEIAAGING